MMTVYYPKEITVNQKKAALAISLPVPKHGNIYFIYEIHLVSKNEMLIHFKDLTGKDFIGDSDIFESFIIDLTDSKFVDFDFSKKVKILVCLENKDELEESPEIIFKRSYSESTESILITS